MQTTDNRNSSKQQKAAEHWIVTADMGYGHQRAAYPLRDLAKDKQIITINSPQVSSAAELRNWNRMLFLYEAFSRATSIPVIGWGLFGMLDSLLHIPNYYPIRNLSGPTLQSKMLLREINNGLCSGFMQTIRSEYLPVLTTFYAPAIAADMAGHEKIYCVICDADINRVWVADNPAESNIIYFAPCGKAAQRLKSYGIADENIYITGFPLPEELIGGMDMPVLKRNLAQRIVNLDPKGRFRARHEKSIEHFLGSNLEAVQAKEYITITFAVGGAGAQKEIGAALLKALRTELLQNKIHLNIVVGIKANLLQYYQERLDTELRNAGSVQIVYHETMYSYFDMFNNVLQTTDILWTKPSELVFYTALGLPLVLAPAIGSQEKFNKYWITEITSAIKQFSINYTADWLHDLLKNGRLAEAAWAGFLKARKLGTYKIKEVLSTGSMTKSDSPLLR